MMPTLRGEHNAEAWRRHRDQAARWDPGQHEILYRAFDYNYTNFGFVGFYFAPAPYRPGSARMAGFPPKSVVYLDCEQKGPTSRARLAYAGAWADAIRGGPPSFTQSLLPRPYAYCAF